jgi:glutamate synthase (NADPH/NADH) small chain
MAIPRHEMPRQEAAVRARNFLEVALGYTAEDARSEAERCLECKNAPCVKGCPVGIDIPAFVILLRDGDTAGALAKIRERNNLPGVCGRVCPQEEQCEMVCTLGKRFKPVAIGRLERYAADAEIAVGSMQVPTLPLLSGKSAAIVGSGPAGLTVAGDLAMLGHKVTLFEALHETGGVLSYGIPEFRLPKAIVQREVEYVASLGVEIRTSDVVGRMVTIPELLAGGTDAIFVGTGAGSPIFLGIPGENLNGVYSANEYLTRVNLMKSFLFPDYDTPVKSGGRVVVVGGGNVAMDAARCALRLGAEEVTIVYRRSRHEMPAREEEIENAEEEGIVFKLLTNPLRVVGDEKGEVTGVECLKMELGAPDASGRARPVPVAGSEFLIPADRVVMAIGTAANPLIAATTPNLTVNSRGYFVTDPATGRTSLPGVWAGGDIVTGSATVISAMGAGRAAAADMHGWMTKGGEWG